MPPEPVGVGAAWTRSVRETAPVVGNLAVDYRCELKSLEEAAGGKVATVVAKSTASAEGGEITTPRINVKVCGLKIDATMTLKLDTATGLPREVTIAQNGTVEMTLNAPGADGIDAVSKLTSTTRITFAEAPPEPTPRKQD
jgi:hypothetical protein